LINYQKKLKDRNLLIDLSDPHSIRSQRPILIAHRGGHVTDQSPECSIAAIQFAKQQGYAMVELDIQQSKDRVPIKSMIPSFGINIPHWAVIIHYMFF
jgi:glycerophosphoryl diester phosphodiesterase